VGNIKPPKSKAGYRTLDVPQWYLNEVNDYRETHHTIYIFTGDDGNLISQSTYKRFWNRIYNKINVSLGGTPKILYQNKVKDKGIAATDLTPYVFRHNYCTMLYYLHVDIKEASRIMGHSNSRITLEIYTHFSHVTIF
jgi:integrase